MKFGEAVKTCFSKYCCFKGRARRAEFWYWVLFEMIVCAVVSFIIGFIGGLTGNDTNTAVSVANSIIELALLLPGLGVAVRRLHDIGKSGWFLLINLIPVVGSIIVLVWNCKDSAAEENKYGPNPKA